MKKDKPKEPKVSRGHFSVVSLDDKSDKKYWQSRSDGGAAGTYAIFKVAELHRL